MARALGAEIPESESVVQRALEGMRPPRGRGRGATAEALMASITAVSIRRPVATAMIYLILIVVGVVAFRSLPVDLLPEVEFTQLTVRVSYPNVGPEEVERIITDPIENAVAGLPNLERVTSRSQEGSSRVRLEFARGTNIDEAANDLRAALDGLRDELPIEADAPRIFKLDLDRIEVVSLAVTSTRHLADLTAHPRGGAGAAVRPDPRSRRDRRPGRSLPGDPRRARPRSAAGLGTDGARRAGGAGARERDAADRHA